MPYSHGVRAVQTFAAAKMSLTDCAISGPIPSPSMSVTL